MIFLCVSASVSTDTFTPNNWKKSTAALGSYTVTHTDIMLVGSDALLWYLHIRSDSWSNWKTKGMNESLFCGK